MKNKEYFKNKKIIVVGLGRSGFSCANLLYELGAKIWVSDNKESELTIANAAKLKAKKIEIELGRHSPEFIKGKDLLILSPGVPASALPVIWAKEFKVPIISEIEFAWILCPATVIAVTGSCGKTTVTTLIANLLEAAHKKVFLCGNIGNPFSQEIKKMQEEDFVSLEVSSFQLETIRNFKPKISVILNFSCNHLDRYKDMKEYLEAKKRIFMNQDENDFLILNSADPVLRELVSFAKAKIKYFSSTAALNPNQAAVLAVGSILGIKKELCLEVFKKFSGVQHRLEYVSEINQIKFINDSKATTVESTLWALKNITEPIILIAGGKDKGLDYQPILDLARKKVKVVILIGQAKEKLRKVFSGTIPINEANSLEDAVNLGFKMAAKGDTVLLSPMCSSFDMFSDYEERGRVFKKAVQRLNETVIDNALKANYK
jgi:UDP-N-acetylmuramoylalanine--D-glutamate ligase